MSAAEVFGALVMLAIVVALGVFVASIKNSIGQMIAGSLLAFVAASLVYGWSQAHR